MRSEIRIRLSRVDPRASVAAAWQRVRSGAVAAGRGGCVCVGVVDDVSQHVKLLLLLTQPGAVLVLETLLGHILHG